VNCEAVEELLAAYALDAVDDDERAEIEAHLATCDLHQEAADLLATAAGLAALSEEREPSEALEARMMTSVAEVSGGSVAVLRPERGRRGVTLRWPAAVAAAVVLAVAGFGAGALLTSGGGDEAAQVVQVVRNGEAWMRAEAMAGESPVKVTLAGLRRLPPSEGYQVWAIRDDSWVSVGICNTDDDGWWEGDFDFALDPGDALAVTVEPRDGSERPSGDTILRSSAWERPTE